MSGKLAGEVYEYEFKRGEQAVLLAMADHAQDDGTDCFPSIARVAWKTGYGDRQIKRTIKDLRAKGVLIEVAPPRQHRPTEYRIDLSAATPKEPFKPRGDISDRGKPRGDIEDPPGVTSDASRGDIAVSPEPSDEPSRREPCRSRPAEQDEIRQIFDYWVEKLSKRKPKLSDKRKARVTARLKEGFTPRELCEAIIGVTLSPHNMGDNERRRPYNDLELICRDVEHVEAFRDLHREQLKAKSGQSDANARRKAVRRAQGLDT